MVRNTFVGCDPNWKKLSWRLRLRRFQKVLEARGRSAVQSKAYHLKQPNWNETKAMEHGKCAWMQHLFHRPHTTQPWVLHHKSLCCLLKGRLLWLVNPTFHACDDCLTLLAVSTRFNFLASFLKSVVSNICTRFCS